MRAGRGLRRLCRPRDGGRRLVPARAGQAADVLANERRLLDLILGSSPGRARAGRDGARTCHPRAGRAGGRDHPDGRPGRGRPAQDAASTLEVVLTRISTARAPRTRSATGSRSATAARRRSASSRSRRCSACRWTPAGAGRPAGAPGGSLSGQQIDQFQPAGAEVAPGAGPARGAPGPPAPRGRRPAGRPAADHPGPGHRHGRGRHGRADHLLVDLPARPSQPSGPPCWCRVREPTTATRPATSSTTSSPACFAPNGLLGRSRPSWPSPTPQP